MKEIRLKLGLVKRFFTTKEGKLFFKKLFLGLLTFYVFGFAIIVHLMWFIKVLVGIFN